MNLGSKSSAVQRDEQFPASTQLAKSNSQENCFDIPFDNEALHDLLTEVQESNLTMMNRIQEYENDFDQLK